MWKEIQSFPLPTFQRLITYRPSVSDNHFGNRSLINLITSIRYEVNCTAIYDNIIWVGFGFYEGEGSEGYGGIGYFDIQSNSIGVLRLPALVDYSVDSIWVTHDAIYLRTVGHYELSSSVGNGIIIIDKNTYSITSLLPPGTTVLWDKDSDESAGKYYDRPLHEILSDKRFHRKQLELGSDSVRLAIVESGLGHFMKQTARSEKLERSMLFSHVRQIVDTTFIVSSDDILFNTDHVYFHISPSDYWVKNYCQLFAGADMFSLFISVDDEQSLSCEIVAENPSIRTCPNSKRYTDITNQEDCLMLNNGSNVRRYIAGFRNEVFVTIESPKIFSSQCKEKDTRFTYNYFRCLSIRLQINGIE